MLYYTHTHTNSKLNHIRGSPAGNPPHKKYHFGHLDFPSTPNKNKGRNRRLSKNYPLGVGL
ncbi:hypothetical protein OAV88_02695 [bacterium]|nr:hypothetical protein [bacterium]